MVWLNWLWAANTQWASNKEKTNAEYSHPTSPYGTECMAKMTISYLNSAIAVAAIFGIAIGDFIIGTHHIPYGQWRKMVAQKRKLDWKMNNTQKHLFIHVHSAEGKNEIKAEEMEMSKSWWWQVAPDYCTESRHRWLEGRMTCNRLKSAPSVPVLDGFFFFFFIHCVAVNSSLTNRQSCHLFASSNHKLWSSTVQYLFISTLKRQMFRKKMLAATLYVM